MDYRDRFKKLLEDNKVSQRQFADKYSIGQAHVNRVCRRAAHLTIEQLTLVCKHFKIKADWLLFGDRDLFEEIQILRSELEKAQKRSDLFSDNFEALVQAQVILERAVNKAMKGFPVEYKEYLLKLKIGDN